MEARGGPKPGETWPGKKLLAEQAAEHHEHQGDRGEVAVTALCALAPSPRLDAVHVAPELSVTLAALHVLALGQRHEPIIAAAPAPPSFLGRSLEGVSADLGSCKNARCTRPAVKVAVLEGINRVTGERERVEQPVCEEHFRELSRSCEWKGCGLWASNVVPMTGTSAATGEHVEDEFGMCDRHYEEFINGATVVIDGITMVHDGHGRFRRLPTNIGRG